MNVTESVHVSTKHGSKESSIIGLNSKTASLNARKDAGHVLQMQLCKGNTKAIKNVEKIEKPMK